MNAIRTGSSNMAAEDQVTISFQCGEMFNSCDEFFEKVRRFEESSFIKLYKRSSRTIASTLRRAPKKQFNDRLKYTEIDMACIHGGKKFVSTSTGKRPSTSTFQMHCPFMLKLRASQDGEKLVVTSVNDEHNHDVSEATFRHLPHQRKMNAEQQEQVKTMLQMKANKKLVQQHIKKQTGQFVLLKDLHNMCGKEKGAPAVNLEAVVNELRQSKDAVVEVVEKEGILQAIFYQRKEWQHTYSLYPEVVLIDATYKLNDLRMPLYLMLCVDGNGESEVVAMWLVTSEDKLTMKTMVGFFKKHNNVQKTTCVMADKDWVERDVIISELPHATLLICLFHTLRTFRREVSEKAMGIDQAQRQHALEIIEKLAYSVNEAEYATHKVALLALNLPKVTNYFLKQWDGIRHQWVEGLKNNSRHLLNNTNNRLESINQKIKDVVGRRLDLLQFFKELLKYFDSMTQERDHRAAMIFAKVPVDLHKDNPLADYQRYLTPYAFSAVKRQHQMSDNISIPDGSETSLQMERRDGLITISTTACECGFFRAMSLPCRHMFALRKFHGLALFDGDSCAQRWTRNYYRQHRVLIDPVDIPNVQVDVSSAPISSRLPSQHEKYRTAFQHAQKLASICSELPLRQFFPSLKVLEQLSSAWQEGKHVTIQVLNSSDHQPTSTEPCTATIDIVPQNSTEEDIPSGADSQPSNFHTNENIHGQTQGADHQPTPTEPCTATIDIVPQTSTEEDIPSGADSQPSNFHTNENIHGQTQGADYHYQPSSVPLQVGPVTDTHSFCVSVDVHHSFDHSPIKNSAHPDTCVGSNSSQPCLEQTRERTVKDIELPTKMLKRGRPKGADLTVIGLPLKRKIVNSGPKPFVTLSDKVKDMTILKMIVGDKFEVSSNRLLTVSDIAVNLPLTLLEDCVNFQRVRQYFERGAFIVLSAKLKRLKDSAVWLCAECDQDTALHTKAVACDSCLQWHHAKCVNATGKLPRSRFWFCKKCSSS